MFSITRFMNMGSLMYVCNLFFFFGIPRDIADPLQASIWFISVGIMRKDLIL